MAVINRFLVKEVESDPELNEQELSADIAEDFRSMYLDSLRNVTEGEVVTGRVVAVDKDYVLVDVGYKSEGVIPVQEWFDEGTDGLIALSGGRHGDVGVALLQGNAKAAERAASAWAARFPNRYYLEVQRAGFADDDALVAATVGIASELALPVVATHPVQFASRDDFRPHEARVCIAEGHVLADTRRPRRFTTEQYFTTQAEMAEKFADLPQALANTVAIAQRCNLAIQLGKNYLPEFPTPAGVTIA